jgi:hypothetical protein
MELLLRKFREGLAQPGQQQQQQQQVPVQQQQQQQKVSSPSIAQPMSTTQHTSLPQGTLHTQEVTPTAYTDGGASTYSAASTATAPSFISAAAAATAADGQEMGQLGSSHSGTSNAAVGSAGGGAQGGQEWMLAAAYSDGIDGDSQGGVSWGGSQHHLPDAW